MDSLAKICSGCKEEKPFEQFHVAQRGLNGLTAKCKQCRSNQATARHKIKSQDPAFVAANRKKSRDFASKNPRSPRSNEVRIPHNKAYAAKYPEKQAAHLAAAPLQRAKGYENHHWSYCEEHHTDVISLKTSVHKLLHRHLTYDAVERQYRASSNGVLLNSKQMHQQYIELIISENA